MSNVKKCVIFMIVVCALLFSAFYVIPSVRLSNRDGYRSDISYRSALLDDNKLILTVKYEDNGDFFEIGRDLIVSTDENFENTLRIRSCKVENNNYIYEFNGENINTLKTIYIKPPILYFSEEINPVSVQLIPGNAVIVTDNNLTTNSKDKVWFSIDEVNIDELTNGTYSVQVLIKANDYNLPRFPKLVNAERQVGGISSLYFDENDDFEYGEFLFSINAENESEALMFIEHSNLMISDALIRVDADASFFSSNIKSISIVVKE